MSKKISTVADLPDWFQSTDYSVSKELSPFDWLIHLRRRRFAFMINRALDRMVDPSDESVDELANWRSQVLHEIRQDPVRRFPDGCDIGDHAPNLYLAGRVPGPTLKQAVRQPTMHEMNEFIQVLPKDLVRGIGYGRRVYGDDEDYFRGEIEEWVPYWIDPDVWWHTPARELILDDEAILFEEEKPFANFLVVDMEQNDEAIFESFKVIIKSLRKDCVMFDAAVDQNVRLHFDRWARYSILAFLDLQQWCTENDYIIPNRVYADALSRFRAVGEENIRKTIHPTARRAISRSTLMRLESYVASQRAKVSG